MINTALYVYAIVPTPVEAGWIGGLLGIDRNPVYAIPGPEGIAALVHEAEPVPFQGDDEQVKGWILEHSRVVEYAWEMAGTILPVTFNVLVRSEGEKTASDRLRDWLEGEGPSMRERLNRLRGRVELRVEISLDRAAVAEGDAALVALRKEIEGKPPGLRRLLERKVQHEARHAADQLADSLYPHYRRRIAGRVEDLAEQRRSGRAPSGEVPVLSTAVLVPRDGIEPLGSELARIQEEQSAARIRFLGPWPPYAFADSPSPVGAIEEAGASGKESST